MDSLLWLVIGMGYVLVGLVVTGVEVRFSPMDNLRLRTFRGGERGEENRLEDLPVISRILHSIFWVVPVVALVIRLLYFLGREFIFFFLNGFRLR